MWGLHQACSTVNDPRTSACKQELYLKTMPCVYTCACTRLAVLSSSGTDATSASACSLHPGSTILMFHRLTSHAQSVTSIVTGHHYLCVGSA